MCVHAVVAVVDVFPSWCSPCRPLKLIAKAFVDVRFVAVNGSAVHVFDKSGVRVPETSQPTFVLCLVRAAHFPKSTAFALMFS